MGETITRTLSGLVYIILLTAAIFHSTFTFLLLFGIFLMIAVVEFCGLLHFKPYIPLMIAVTGYALFAVFPVSLMTSLLLAAASIFVAMQSIFALFNDKRPASDSTAKYVLLLGYIIIPFILITKIPYSADGYAPEILIGLLVIFWANDTFAFIFGKTLGKHKLMERVSPKKTVEGFAGGLVFSIVAGFCVAIFYVDQPVLLWGVAALLVSVMGTIGDLVESRLKRIAMVKDSGRIMPGHGGILDRLDSVIFAAPFVFLFFQIMSYVS